MPPSTPVRSVHASRDGVEVRDDADASSASTRVVIATHPHQALAMLAEPTAPSARCSAPSRYSRNHAVLHTDESVLPRHRPGAGSWNYRLPSLRRAPDRGAGQLRHEPAAAAGRAATGFMVTLDGDDRVDPADRASTG